MTIKGDDGRWEFRDSSERVTIVNNSDKPLSIGDIRTYNDPSTTRSRRSSSSTPRTRP